MEAFPPAPPSSEHIQPGAAHITPCSMELDTDDSSSESSATSTQLPTNAIRWPKEEIPVEIFEIIISHVSRADIRNLRLVCREFDSKATAQYFRNVVVPFKSELYSTLTHDENGVLRSSAPLFSNGMRIFQSFGRHIWRFALSLELDEDALAYPPIKPSQQAVPSFWGMYRWPHPTYHRYTDLEGLEQTGDETEAMKDALNCLVRVTNLGLCCDAGLGFLNGPDNIARSATIRQPVFATQNWRRAPQELERQGQSIVNMPGLPGQAQSLKKPVFDNPISFKHSVLHKMATDAGYTGSDIDEAIRLVLETESTSLSLIDFDERSLNYDRRPIGSSRMLSDFRILPEFEPSVDVASHPLIPSSLTRAQKEMLLELEWAHRAMIQSYVIALIDNASLDGFQHLTTLTIAKIPSCHVHILYRHELWENLTNLSNLHLGVIADWRRVTKPIPGCIEDTHVSPVEAVSKVFHLLDTYVGAARNIESLHFEWICGGEFAPGTFQRNHYILPAPFFQSPELMALPESPVARENELLSLPFVKHLSLKNCWSSPHVFLETIRHMAVSSLEKLELESVSLSGPPTTVNQAPLHQPIGAQVGHAANLLNLFQLGGVPDPLQQVHPLPGGTHWPGFAHAPAQQNQQLPHLPLNHLVNFPQGQFAPPAPAPAPAPAPPPPPPAPLAESQRLELPDWLTWAGMLEHFSPGMRVRDIIDRQTLPDHQTPIHVWSMESQSLAAYVPRASKLISDEKKYTLKCLSFKSCGYVAVDCPFINTRFILPRGAQGLGGNGNPHNQDFSALMQGCKDGLLGRIAPHIKDTETAQLVNAFGMELGWENVYGEQQIAAAEADGVERPGRGRFSGRLEECSPEAREARNSQDMPSSPDLDISMFM